MSLTATADALFSRLVRARGHCEKCGSTHLLECAHVISRTWYSTRWDPTNARCLCAACHRWFHSRPTKWRGWIGEDEWSRLHLKAHDVKKTDLTEILSDLRRRLKEVAA